MACGSLGDRFPSEVFSEVSLFRTEQGEPITHLLPSYDVIDYDDILAAFSLFKKERCGCFEVTIALTFAPMIPSRLLRMSDSTVCSLCAWLHKLSMVSCLLVCLVW